MQTMPDIKPMTQAHLSDVIAIEKAVSPHPWRENQFVESLRHQHCFVMEVDDKLAGYLIYSLIAGESELFNIAVAAECQGRGFGRLLIDFYLRQLEGKVSDAFLDVRSDNHAALSLYGDVGYNEIGRRRNYYPTQAGPRDAIIMGKSIYSSTTACAFE